MTLIIITVLIYSLLLTIVTFYKDNSSYFSVETIDIIMAGPVMWIIFLIFLILKPIYKSISKSTTKKNKQYKVKNSDYIAKIVKRIIKEYKKKNYTKDYFDFSFRQGEYNVNDIEGWGRLLRQTPKNERLNNKFCSLMYHQKAHTIRELEKYCILVDKEIMRNDDCDEWFINKHKNKKILKIV